MKSPHLTLVPSSPAPVVANTHPVLAHAARVARLQTERVTRMLGDAHAAAEVFAFGGDPDSWRELMQMQGAAWRRLRTLQDRWLDGWAQWMQHAGQIGGANTMSKLVEREANIGVRLTQLLGAQFTDLVALQENVEVDYSCWIDGKLAEKRRGLATSPGPSPPS